MGQRTVRRKKGEWICGTCGKNEKAHFGGEQTCALDDPGSSSEEEVIEGESSNEEQSEEDDDEEEENNHSEGEGEEDEGGEKVFTPGGSIGGFVEVDAGGNQIQDRDNHDNLSLKKEAKESLGEEDNDKSDSDDSTDSSEEEPDQSWAEDKWDWRGDEGGQSKSEAILPESENILGNNGRSKLTSGSPWLNVEQFMAPQPEQRGTWNRASVIFKQAGRPETDYDPNISIGGFQFNDGTSNILWQPSFPQIPQSSGGPQVPPWGDVGIPQTGCDDELGFGIDYGHELGVVEESVFSRPASISPSGQRSRCQREFPANTPGAVISLSQSTSLDTQEATSAVGNVPIETQPVPSISISSTQPPVDRGTGSAPPVLIEKEEVILREGDTTSREFFQRVDPAQTVNCDHHILGDKFQQNSDPAIADAERALNVGENQGEACIPKIAAASPDVDNDTYPKEHNSAERTSSMECERRGPGGEGTNREPQHFHSHIKKQCEEEFKPDPLSDSTEAADSGLTSKVDHPKLQNPEHPKNSENHKQDSPDLSSQNKSASGFDGPTLTGKQQKDPPNPEVSPDSRLPGQPSTVTQLATSSPSISRSPSTRQHQSTEPLDDLGIGNIDCGSHGHAKGLGTNKNSSGSETSPFLPKSSISLSSVTSTIQTQRNQADETSVKFESPREGRDVTPGIGGKRLEEEDGPRSSRKDAVSVAPVTAEEEKKGSKSCPESGSREVGNKSWGNGVEIDEFRAADEEERVLGNENKEGSHMPTPEAIVGGNDGKKPTIDQPQIKVSRSIDSPESISLPSPEPENGPRSTFCVWENVPDKSGTDRNVLACNVNEVGYSEKNYPHGETPQPSRDPPLVATRGLLTNSNMSDWGNGEIVKKVAVRKNIDSENREDLIGGESGSLQLQTSETLESDLCDLLAPKRKENSPPAGDVKEGGLEKHSGRYPPDNYPNHESKSDRGDHNHNDGSKTREIPILETQKQGIPASECDQKDCSTFPAVQGDGQLIHGNSKSADYRGRQDKIDILQSLHEWKTGTLGDWHDVPPSDVPAGGHLAGPTESLGMDTGEIKMDKGTSSSGKLCPEQTTGFNCVTTEEIASPNTLSSEYSSRAIGISSGERGKVRVIQDNPPPKMLNPQQITSAIHDANSTQKNRYNLTQSMGFDEPAIETEKGPTLAAVIPSPDIACDSTEHKGKESQDLRSADKNRTGSQNTDIMGLQIQSLLPSSNMNSEPSSLFIEPIDPNIFSKIDADEADGPSSRFEDTKLQQPEPLLHVISGSTPPEKERSTGELIGKESQVPEAISKILPASRLNAGHSSLHFGISRGKKISNSSTSSEDSLSESSTDSDKDGTKRGELEISRLSGDKVTGTQLTITSGAPGVNEVLNKAEHNSSHLRRASRGNFPKSSTDSGEDGNDNAKLEVLPIISGPSRDNCRDSGLRMSLSENYDPDVVHSERTLAQNSVIGLGTGGSTQGSESHVGDNTSSPQFIGSNKNQEVAQITIPSTYQEKLTPKNSDEEQNSNTKSDPQLSISPQGEAQITTPAIGGENSLTNKTNKQQLLNVETGLQRPQTPISARNEPKEIQNHGHATSTKQYTPHTKGEMISHSSFTDTDKDYNPLPPITPPDLQSAAAQLPVPPAVNASNLIAAEPNSNSRPHAESSYKIPSPDSLTASGSGNNEDADQEGPLAKQRKPRLLATEEGQQELQSGRGPSENKYRSWRHKGRVRTCSGGSVKSIDKQESSDTERETPILYRRSSKSHRKFKVGRTMQKKLAPSGWSESSSDSEADPDESESTISEDLDKGRQVPWRKSKTPNVPDPTKSIRISTQLPLPPRRKSSIISPKTLTPPSSTENSPASQGVMKGVPPQGSPQGPARPQKEQISPGSDRNEGSIIHDESNYFGSDNFMGGSKGESVLDNKSLFSENNNRGNIWNDKPTFLPGNDGFRGDNMLPLWQANNPDNTGILQAPPTIQYPSSAALAAPSPVHPFPLHMHMEITSDSASSERKSIQKSPAWGKMPQSGGLFQEPLFPTADITVTSVVTQTGPSGHASQPIQNKSGGFLGPNFPFSQPQNHPHTPQPHSEPPQIGGSPPQSKQAPFTEPFTEPHTSHPRLVDLKADLDNSIPTSILSIPLPTSAQEASKAKGKGMALDNKNEDLDRKLKELRELEERIEQTRREQQSKEEKKAKKKHEKKEKEKQDKKGKKKAIEEDLLVDELLDQATQIPQQNTIQFGSATSVQQVDSASFGQSQSQIQSQLQPKAQQVVPLKSSTPAPKLVDVDQWRQTPQSGASNLPQVEAIGSQFSSPELKNPLFELQNPLLDRQNLLFEQLKQTIDIPKRLPDAGAQLSSQVPQPPNDPGDGESAQPFQKNGPRVVSYQSITQQPFAPHTIRHSIHPVMSLTDPQLQESNAGGTTNFQFPNMEPQFAGTPVQSGTSENTNGHNVAYPQQQYMPPAGVNSQQQFISPGVFGTTGQYPIPAIPSNPAADAYARSEHLGQQPLQPAMSSPTFDQPSHPRVQIPMNPLSTVWRNTQRSAPTLVANNPLHSLDQPLAASYPQQYSQLSASLPPASVGVNTPQSVISTVLNNASYPLQPLYQPSPGAYQQQPSQNLASLPSPVGSKISTGVPQMNPARSSQNSIAVSPQRAWTGGEQPLGGIGQVMQSPISIQGLSGANGLPPLSTGHPYKQHIVQPSMPVLNSPIAGIPGPYNWSPVAGTQNQFSGALPIQYQQFQGQQHASPPPIRPQELNPNRSSVSLQYVNSQSHIMPQVPTRNQPIPLTPLDTSPVAITANKYQSPVHAQFPSSITGIIADQITASPVETHMGKMAQRPLPYPESIPYPSQVDFRPAGRDNSSNIRPPAGAPPKNVPTLISPQSPTLHGWLGHNVNEPPKNTAPRAPVLGVIVDPYASEIEEEEENERISAARSRILSPASYPTSWPWTEDLHPVIPPKQPGLPPKISENNIRQQQEYRPLSPVSPQRIEEPEDPSRHPGQGHMQSGNVFVDMPSVLSDKNMSSPQRSPHGFGQKAFPGNDIRQRSLKPETKPPEMRTTENTSIPIHSQVLPSDPSTTKGQPSSRVENVFRPPENSQAKTTQAELPQWMREYIPPSHIDTPVSRMLPPLQGDSSPVEQTNKTPTRKEAKGAGLAPWMEEYIPPPAYEGKAVEPVRNNPPQSAGVAPAVQAAAAQAPLPPWMEEYRPPTQRGSPNLASIPNTRDPVRPGTSGVPAIGRNGSLLPTEPRNDQERRNDYSGLNRQSPLASHRAVVPDLDKYSAPDSGDIRCSDVLPVEEYERAPQGRFEQVRQQERFAVLQDYRARSAIPPSNPPPNSGASERRPSSQPQPQTARQNQLPEWMQEYKPPNFQAPFRRRTDEERVPIPHAPNFYADPWTEQIHAPENRWTDGSNWHSSASSTQPGRSGALEMTGNMGGIQRHQGFDNYQSLEGLPGRGQPSPPSGWLQESSVRRQNFNSPISQSRDPRLPNNYPRGDGWQQPQQRQNPGFSPLHQQYRENGIDFAYMSPVELRNNEPLYPENFSSLGIAADPEPLPARLRGTGPGYDEPYYENRNPRGHGRAYPELEYNPPGKRGFTVANYSGNIGFGGNREDGRLASDEFENNIRPPPPPASPGPPTFTIPGLTRPRYDRQATVSDYMAGNQCPRDHSPGFLSNSAAAGMLDDPSMFRSRAYGGYNSAANRYGGNMP